ncbi:MAG: ribosome recycling factor [Puniceicoccales bacterium]|jgi:ribosome recycling factor|nr:ribosome recycling factor [Puniceicoccales bacterium]
MDQAVALKILRDQLKKVLQHVEAEFATVFAGKATVAMVDSVVVEAYGTPTKLRDIAAITTPDARTISIQPWDKGTTRAIEKGILLANIGFNPIVDADRIRCVIPEMSLERRQELVKRTSTMAEAGRVAARNIRREVMEVLKAAQKSGKISEDDLKRAEKVVQKEIDDCITAIGTLFIAKEKELLAL